MKARISLLLIIFSAFLCLPATAQSARSILDKTARIIAAGSVQATFEATSYSGTKQVGETNGNIYIKGTKFHIDSPGLQSWFDGKTLWSYLKNSGEVNVSNPSKAEIQSMNPYYFINLYKSGYSLSQKSSSIRGKSCYEVRLLAQNSHTAIQEVLIDIDPQTSLPLCLRMREGYGKWTRISVSSIKAGKKISDSFFRFNSKNYPKLEVIDLR